MIRLIVDSHNSPTQACKQNKFHTLDDLVGCCGKNERLLILRDDRNGKKMQSSNCRNRNFLFLVQFSRRLFNSTTELVQNLSRLSSVQEAVSMADKEGYD